MSHKVTQVQSKIISEDFINHGKRSFLNESNIDAFLAACCRPLRKSIRVNSLKIKLKDFKEKVEPDFNALGFRLIEIPWCLEGFWLESVIELSEKMTEDNKQERSIGNLPSHIQGLFYIQEASSMLPPLALLTALKKENEDNLLLDLAAAPGSKTTQMAALFENKGLILANELSASRVKVLYANLVRCGISNTCMSQFDGRKLGVRLSSLFDFVLLDAPCGGEGTVRKDQQALKNWQLHKVEEISKLQKELILTAFQCLKPGGKLVYSTCTLSPEENQQVAEHLINETNAEVVNLKGLFEGAEKSCTQEGFLHVLPHIYDSEGFFVAAFTKPIDSVEVFYADSDGKKVDNHHFMHVNKKVLAQLLDYYHSHFGLELSKLSPRLKQRDKEIWLFPDNFEKISSVVRLNRSGIKIAEIYPNKVRSTHEFITVYAENITAQKLEVTLSQAEDFFKGRNLDLTECLSSSAFSLKDGEVILTLNGQSIGFAGLSKNKIKNQLPRDLVRDQIKFLN